MEETYNYTISALVYLETLITSQECSLILCRVLADFQQSDQVHVLALSLLHRWIERWWNLIPADSHLEIRKLIISLVSNARPEISVNYSGKLASILAEVSLRDFPQYWPSMVSDYLSVIHSETPARFIVIKAIQYIMVDCSDEEFSSRLPSQRKQDILSGLKVFEGEICLQILLLLRTQISFQFNGYLESQHTRCLCLCFDLLLVLSRIFDVEIILQEANNVLWIAVKCFGLPTVQFHALSFAESLLSRKLSKELTYKCIFLLAVERSLILPQDFQFFLRFIRQYSCILTKVLAVNLTHIASLNETELASSKLWIDQLLSEVLECIQADSFKVIGEVLPQLIQMYKNDSITHVDKNGNVALKLLAVTSRKVLRPNIPTKLSEQPQWYKIEFDDREEFLDYYALVLSQFSSFVSLVAGQFPDVSLRFLAVEIGALADCNFDLNFVARSKYQLINSFLQSLSTSVATEIQAHPESSARQLAFEIIAFVLDWMPGNTELLAFKTRTILNLFPVIQLFLPALDFSGKILVCFKEYLSVLRGFCTGKNADSIRFLEDVCSSYVDLFQVSLESFKCNEPVIKVLEEITSCIEMAPPSSLEGNLREIMLILSQLFASDDYAQRRIIQSAFETSFIRSMSLAEHLFTSPYSLIELLFSEEAKTISALEQICAVFTSFSRVISLISSSNNRRSNNEIKLFPLFDLWKQFLNFAELLFRHLSSLWQPAAFSILYEALISKFPNTIEKIYGPALTDIRKFSGFKDKLPEQITESLKFKEKIRSLLSIIFKIFGLASKHHLLFSLISFPTFSSNLINAIKFQETSHYVLLIRYFIASLIANLDAKCESSCVQFMTFFQAFLSSSVERITIIFQEDTCNVPANLNACNELQYRTLIYKEQFLIHSDFCGLEEEFISTYKANVKIDYVRAISELFGTIFGIRGPFAASGELPGSVNLKENKRELMYLLMSDKFSNYNCGSIEWFLQLYLLCFQTGDSSCWKELLGCLRFFVYFSLKEARYRNFLGGTVFRALVSSLLTADKRSVGLEWDLLDGVLEIYLFYVTGMDTRYMIESSDIVNSLSDIDLKQICEGIIFPLSLEPRDVLMATQLLREEDILSFEINLSKLQSRKKQRALTKDLFTKMKETKHPDSSQLEKIRDIPISSRSKNQKSKHDAVIALADNELGNLFS